MCGIRPGLTNRKMKRCPQCRRDYIDDTLSFCLEDGTRLVDGASAMRVAPDESPTEMMSERPEISMRDNSIAVLPFANVSAEAENDYFCDGLAEELLNALAKIEGLKVAARTSAFSFKGKNIDAGEIGKALRVNTILE